MHMHRTEWRLASKATAEEPRQVVSELAQPCREVSAPTLGSMHRILTEPASPEPGGTSFTV
jgi:hypothetical protein